MACSSNPGTRLVKSYSVVLIGSFVETLYQDLGFCRANLAQDSVFTSSCAWSTSSAVSGDLHLPVEEFSSGTFWLRDRRMRTDRIGLQV